MRPRCIECLLFDCNEACYFPLYHLTRRNLPGIGPVHFTYVSNAAVSLVRSTQIPHMYYGLCYVGLGERCRCPLQLLRRLGHGKGTRLCNCSDSRPLSRLMAHLSVPNMPIFRLHRHTFPYSYNTYMCMPRVYTLCKNAHTTPIQLHIQSSIKVTYSQ